MIASVSDIYGLCGRLRRHEVDQPTFVRDCCRMTAEVIHCSRAGIWLFDDDDDDSRRLRCLGIYDRVNHRMTWAPDETDTRVRPYFDALATIGHVMAPDARLHPATAGFFADELGSNGVRSLLASSFSVNGRLLGAFTCTQVRAIAHWTPGQLAALKRIGARASLAIAQAARADRDPQALEPGALPVL